MSVKSWISGDENAKEMLARIRREITLLSFPPFQSFPLTAGSVVEIAGPSSSAKTDILIQAALNCVLPKALNGGGFESTAVYVDLDCRFDVLRLSKLVNHQIAKSNRATNCYQEEICGHHGELFEYCMKRFLYMRCYNSLEFVAALKTLHVELRKNRGHEAKVSFLLIDSIGAFRWVDRVSGPQPARKVLSHHFMSEIAVREIQKLMRLHPLLVFVAKTTSLDTCPDGRNLRSVASNDTSDTGDSTRCHVAYREYMPSIWQSFVTHRMMVHPTGQEQSIPAFQSQWLMPPLCFTEKFIVKEDEGIAMISHPTDLG